MTLIINKKTKTVRHIDGFQCNRCKKKYLADDFVHMQDMFYYRDTGGYGSVWGDETSFEITLCGTCFKELVESHVVYPDPQDEYQDGFDSDGNWLDIDNYNILNRSEI